MKHRAVHFEYILAQREKGISAEELISTLTHRKYFKVEIVCVEGWWLHADLIREVYADPEHYRHVIAEIKANPDEIVKFWPPSESVLRNFPKAHADRLRLLALAETK